MHIQQSRRSRVVVDVESLLSLENNCNGCAICQTACVYGAITMVEPTGATPNNSTGSVA